MIYKLYCNGSLVGANEDVRKIYSLADKIVLIYGPQFFTVVPIEGRVH